MTAQEAAENDEEVEAIADMNREAYRNFFWTNVVPNTVTAVAAPAAGAVARSNQRGASYQLSEALPPRISAPAKSAPLLTPQPSAPFPVYSDAPTFTGPFVTEPASDAAPVTPRKGPRPQYNRNKTARKEALLRDAKDPRTKLTEEQRAFIEQNQGRRVPKDAAVSHEQPLYTVPPRWRWMLDVPENMLTIPKPDHGPRHQPGGDQYEKYGPPWVYQWNQPQRSE